MELHGGGLRLASSCPDARALGLVPGMTLADARARVPDIAVADADPTADRRLLERLADDCDRWTMMVQTDGADGLLLDVTGCTHLFDGEVAMRKAVASRLVRGGLAVRATIAGTPDAARGLARFGRIGIVPPGQDAEAVRELPVAALGVEPGTIRALSGAGLRSVGDLADRSQTPLAARFGEGLTRRLRRILGQEDARLNPRRPAPDHAAEQRFVEPIGRASDMERALEALAGTLAVRLEAEGKGGRAFEAGFFRTDGAVRRIAVETGMPTRDPATLLRLFVERLDALADPIDPGFGFDMIRLAVLRSEPFGDVQPDLDRRGVADETLSGLVDRLVARFGRSRVLRFVADDTHDPDRATRYGSAAEIGPAEGTAWPAPEPGEPGARPLQMFEPPQPIETLAEVPDGPPVRFRWRRILHEIARAEGPERIAPEWWRDAGGETRDYYRVEDRNGRRFWVFRQGLYGGGGRDPRWFLHGLFP